MDKSKDGIEWKVVAKIHDSFRSAKTIENQLFFMGGSGLLHSKNRINWNYLESNINLEDITLVDDSFILTGFSYWLGNEPVPGPPIMIKSKDELLAELSQRH